MTNWDVEDLNRKLKDNPDMKVISGLVRPAAEVLVKSNKKDERETLLVLYEEHFEHREMILCEPEMQASFVLWLRGIRDHYPVLEHAFSVPNGGYRAWTTAKQMKAEGTEQGVPDYWFVKQYKGYIGLVIEFKRKYNKPSPEQIKWLNRLQAEGWRCAVCWSKLDAQLLVCEHYDIPLEEI